MDDTDINPPPKRGRRRAVAAESFDPTTESNAVIPFHKKSEEQLNYLHEAAKDIIFFNKCDEEQQNVLYNAMFEKDVLEDEMIIRQGDDGDNFYIIEKGEYDIYINDEFDNQKCVATLKGRGYFGELALLYNCPRNATIIAKTDGTLWGLDQKTFREIVVKATAKKRQAFEDLLKSVSILDSLTQYELMNLTDALNEVQFVKGERIIKEGDMAEKMYFIMYGEVAIRATDKNTRREKEIARLNRGRYFGELALVLNKPRVASVYVETETLKCAVLDIYAFERLLGPCIDIMKRNIENYELERKRLGINIIADDIDEGLSNQFSNIDFN